MNNPIDRKGTNRRGHRDCFRVMHIVLNLEIGGAQETVRILAKYMAKGGHKPVVCAFKDGPLREEIERLGIPVEILPDRRYSILVPHQFMVEMFRIRKELIRLIKKYQVDIIQTHLLQSLDFLVATLHLLKNSPLIYWTIQNYNFTLQKDDLPRFQWLLRPKRFVYRLMYFLSAHWIDGVIAVSDDVKDAILKTIGPVIENKITVICNAVDFDRYQIAENEHFIRKTLGLGEEARVISVVAMLREQKGHRYLIDAAAKVIPRFPDLHILLVGDGVLRESLCAQTEVLGLEKNIHFLGVREDIPDLLAESDYFVLPSLWEGLPLALTEAMASGLPIIATAVSGSKQVMVPEVTGLLIPPGDSQELAEAIIQILSQPERAREMGKAAQKRVKDEFSASKQAKEHIALYRQRFQKVGQLRSDCNFTENI